MDHETLIVLPAYNEAKRIGCVLAGILDTPVAQRADILVVDDGSSDGTGDAARACGVKAIPHPFNLGYGAALMTAYRYAADRGYRYLIQMDADGQHDPRDLGPILDKLMEKDGPDLVLGSRFLSENSTCRVSALKRAAIVSFRFIIRLAAGVRITDPTSGMQGLGADAFRYYAGYGGFDYRNPDADMLIQMLKAGFTICEIPCSFHERQDGKSMHAGFRAVLYMLSMPLSIAGVCAANRRGKRGKGV